jgi:hypothetical protein
MDSGVQLNAKIHKILGGNGYNFGLDILVSEELVPVEPKPVSKVLTISSLSMHQIQINILVLLRSIRGLW